MLRHLVLFKWSEDATPHSIESAKKRMWEYGHSNERCLSFAVSDNAGGNSGNFDTVVTADFATLDDYEIYAVDPQHIAVVERNREAVSDKASIQIEA